MQIPLTRAFAQWGATLDIAAIPPEVSEQGRRAILDLLGVMAAGTTHPLIARLRAANADLPGPCTAAGGHSTHAAQAAVLNGTAAHVLDFDDTSYTGIMHGSAVVLPAVLAAAEERRANGDELFAAFVVGSEVTYTLADIVAHEHYFRGWWSTATFGLIGATAGAARAFGLDPISTAHAIGMAAGSAGATKCVFGTDSKAFLVGETARRAVDFARAAASGVTGPIEAFEDARGFFALLNEGRSRPELAQTLGRRWRLTDPGLLFKLNPVCSGAHAVIEATAKLMQAHNAGTSDIERVECSVPELVKISLVFDRPTTPQEAQFSLPYAVACAVLHGRVRLEDLSVPEVTSSLKRSLMEKVHYEVGPELSHEEARLRYPESSRVKLTLRSGKVVEKFCGEAHGMPKNPLTNAELWRKFATCMAYAGINPDQLGPARAWLDQTTSNERVIDDIIRPLLARHPGS